jgi:hypothetical protein
MRDKLLDKKQRKNRELAADILWLRLLIVLLCILNFTLFLKAEFPVWIHLFH